MRALLVLLAITPGCVKGQPSNDPGARATLVGTFASAAALAAFHRDQSVRNGDVVGCVAGGVLSVAADATAQGLAAIDTASFGPIEVDLTGCVGLGDGSLTGADVSGQVESVVSLVVSGAEAVLLVVGPELARDDCATYALATAAVGLLADLVPEVLDEVEEPDGRVTIPEVSVDQSVCE